jgi:hypothetical protein
MTIPKTAIPYGANPVVYIDGQKAQDQGYTQDTDNFYIWYTTQFSTHQMKIQFTKPQNLQATGFESLLAVGIIVPEIILVYTIMAIRHLKRKPENV